MSGPTGRLLALLSLLQARRDWPGGVLAQRLEVTERTVRRDVDRLRGLGYRVTATKGPDGGYRLESGSELPPLLFDEEQAVALAVALRLATGSGDGTDDGVAQGAARALATVRQVLPSHLRHRVDAVRVTALDRGPAVDPAVIVEVSTAIRRCEVLRFDYGEESPGAPPRRTEAVHLVRRRSRWYVVGWDLDREAWRTYRLDRMRLRTPHGPRFVPRELPAPDVATFVSARFKGSADEDAWPCRGTAVLRAPASEVAPFVGDGDVEALADGTCRVTLGAWSWVALAAALARFDADVEVVAPPELAAACRVLAARFAAAGG
ncbi:WYL domain-containing protein [Nocardioides sp. S-58]|uniref:WYL domain-containing protein n=1 Tax=Nocardioides renjunii TaxID=3095075 RepID=A0ABU5KCX5_9ACTN|nr:WYL domain-containing protein [Nocardioides sp. S-58]MDZ5662704.1 WYL domain-containing protein [Nocardioides sp. S-58]